MHLIKSFLLMLDFYAFSGDSGSARPLSQFDISSRQHSATRDVLSSPAARSDNPAARSDNPAASGSRSASRRDFLASPAAWCELYNCDCITQ